MRARVILGIFSALSVMAPRDWYSVSRLSTANRRFESIATWYQFR
jgi:hypothetical protein